VPVAFRKSCEVQRKVEVETHVAHALHESQTPSNTGETTSIDDYTTLPGGEVLSYTLYFPLHRKGNFRCLANSGLKATLEGRLNFPN
jgi:hypothetical protein